MSEGEFQPGERVKVIACTGHDHKEKPCPFIGQFGIAIDDLGYVERTADQMYDVWIIGEWGRVWMNRRDLESLGAF